MNSIDEGALRRFFAEKLTEVGEALRRRGWTAFPLGPDEDSGTWYADVDDEAPVFVAIEVDGLEAELQRMWEKEELPELAALSAKLVELAHDLHVDEDESAEVSPFMYVMY